MNEDNSLEALKERIRKAKEEELNEIKRITEENLRSYSQDLRKTLNDELNSIRKDIEEVRRTKKEESCGSNGWSVSEVILVAIVAVIVSIIGTRIYVNATKIILPDTIPAAKTEKEILIKWNGKMWYDDKTNLLHIELQNH